jgi:hypothetical protein
MIARNCSFEETCTELFIAFFKNRPHDGLLERSVMAMLAVTKRQKCFPGKHEGWAAGIIFAVGSMGCGVPGVLNSELEKAFGVTMSTIYKRAWAVKRLLGQCPGI